MIFSTVVCDTAKVRFFKQITTNPNSGYFKYKLFAILQKYDFSSKSQHAYKAYNRTQGCLRYCRSTIFQANHNKNGWKIYLLTVVCDTAKVRFFKQITTYWRNLLIYLLLFAILQKYDFSSKSQHAGIACNCDNSCLRYCKSTIFQANHNDTQTQGGSGTVVCDTAKVRFFKQITTGSLTN